MPCGSDSLYYLLVLVLLLLQMLVEYIYANGAFLYSKKMKLRFPVHRNGGFLNPGLRCYGARNIQARNN